MALFVITGVTRGLGRAMTDQLVVLGHIVVGCGRSPHEIGALQQIYSSPHRFSVVDVKQAEAVERWAQELLATQQVPDFLLNNAAAMNNLASAWDVPVEEFDHVVDVNIKGVMNVIRAFAPAMIARKKGVIVNFSSGWGRSVDAQVAPYCTTKWAIEGLTKALAEELPSGMAAVPLNPGIIDTSMLRQCWGDSAASYPAAQDWAKKAVPFILKIKPRDTGQSLTVPS
jgi:NAD(P)-dependent dehydrogenase (short-subunit alcohol dehydrogenase family)